MVAMRNTSSNKGDKKAYYRVPQMYADAGILAVLARRHGAPAHVDDICTTPCARMGKTKSSMGGRHQVSKIKRDCGRAFEAKRVYFGSSGKFTRATS